MGALVSPHSAVRRGSIEVCHNIRVLPELVLRADLTVGRTPGRGKGFPVAKAPVGAAAAGSDSPGIRRLVLDTTHRCPLTEASPVPRASRHTPIAIYAAFPAWIRAGLAALDLTPPVHFEGGAPDVLIPAFRSLIGLTGSAGTVDLTVFPA